MDFNDWYETYERDGGELMVFNTIDLRAAFEAGFKSGYELSEENRKYEDSSNEA